MGIAGAIALVRSSLPALAAALGAGPGDDYGSVLRAFLFAPGAAFVTSVLAAQNRAARTRQLDRAAIVSGLFRAYTVFTRSLCVDMERGEERALTGADPLSVEEIAITGQPCPREMALELAFGRRERTHDGEHPLAAAPPPGDRVIPRGLRDPMSPTYDLLDSSLLQIFEMSHDSLVSQAPRLLADPSAKVAGWPSTISVDTLRLFFKSIGETAPRGSQRGSASRDELARGAILWVAAHRVDLPREGDADYDDDVDDMAPEQRARMPRYRFKECQLRDYLGRSVYRLAVHLGRPIPAGAVDDGGEAPLPLPPIHAACWLPLREWTSANGPPLSTYAFVAQHYSKHFPREQALPLDVNAVSAARAMCRPLYRALRRMRNLAARPIIFCTHVSLVDGVFYVWLRGSVPYSQIVGSMYEISVCVRCTATPADIAAASGLQGDASADLPLVYTMCEVVAVRCPCKQVCARALLWKLHRSLALASSSPTPAVSRVPTLVHGALLITGVAMCSRRLAALGGAAVGSGEHRCARRQPSPDARCLPDVVAWSRPESGRQPRARCVEKVPRVDAGL